MGLNPKGLDAFKEPRLPWLAGFGPRCALHNFCNSSSGTCVTFGNSRATVGLKASANLCFSQISCLCLLRRWREKALLFWNMFKQMFWGIMLVIQQAFWNYRRREHVRLLHFPIPSLKVLLLGFFCPGLIVCVMQTLTCIWCILTEEKWSMPKMNNANFFRGVDSQQCHASFLWAWSFWMQML